MEEVQPVESSDDSVVCWSKDCWGGDDCSTVTGDEDFFLKRKKISYCFVERRTEVEIAIS